MKRYLNILFSVFCLSTFSQVGPYSWQDHISLNSSNSLCRFNGKIYASYYAGIVKFDEEEESTEKLNKSNGLHDVGIKMLRTNTYINKVLVVYENSNIDIIDVNDKVQNYPDIKLKTISGKKVINEVFFIGKYAYLASGVGVIVFDMDKLEIKDTYVIGPNGTNIEVFQVALNDSLIFAATANGLYKSNYKIKILNDYRNWALPINLPAGNYSGVINVSGNLLASYSPVKLNPNDQSDTLYVLKDNHWERFYPIGPNLIRKLSYVNGDEFVQFGQFGSSIINFNTKILKAHISGFNYINPKDVIFFKDKTGNVSYWVAEQNYGFFQTYGSTSYWPLNLKSVNGMNRSYVGNIDIFNGVVAVSPSFKSQHGAALYLREGINTFIKGEWSYFVSQDFNNNSILDINCVLIDRKDNSRIWASAWSNSGLVEFKDQKLVTAYTVSNSPMSEAYSGFMLGGGLAQDKDGNLWIATANVSNYLTVKKRDGAFKTFDFHQPRFTKDVLVDKNNYVWALHEGAGITVFNPDANYSPPQLNVNYRILSKDVNSGNLGTNTIYSIAEDKDGKIWVGTDAGIRVFYNPTNMFSGSNYDAQPIKIIQDGNVELLLEKESIRAITIDGANNKWIGTASGGLYCFNSDGLKQIYHFTKDNSPLYSDYITSLNYDKTTGDIYIATELGLQSFRSVIIEGDENYQNVYAYPNPVKPNYTGNVFVRGLVDNSVVKITDESGNLVWETKSQGGQIEWPVKNLSGSRAASGVYVVYAATTTGELKALTKVLVVN